MHFFFFLTLEMSSGREESIPTGTLFRRKWESVVYADTPWVGEGDHPPRGPVGAFLIGGIRGRARAPRSSDPSPLKRPNRGAKPSVIFGGRYAHGPGQPTESPFSR